MCRRCEAEQNDPRFKAFFNAVLLEVVAQKDLDREQNPDGTFTGLNPMSLLTVFPDAGRAKLETFRLMNLDTVAAVRPHEQIICLN